MKTVAYGASFGRGSEKLILLPPDVAAPVGAQGFTKREAKEFIHMHANASLGKMTQYRPLEESGSRVADHLRGTLSEQELLDKMVAVLESADRYDILVVGADRAKTLVMPTGPSAVDRRSRPVSGRTRTAAARSYSAGIISTLVMCGTWT